MHAGVDLLERSFLREIFLYWQDGKDNHWALHVFHSLPQSSVVPPDMLLVIPSSIVGVNVEKQ